MLFTHFYVLYCVQTLPSEMPPAGHCRRTDPRREGGSSSRSTAVEVASPQMAWLRVTYILTKTGVSEEVQQIKKFNGENLHFKVLCRQSIIQVTFIFRQPWQSNFPEPLRPSRISHLQMFTKINRTLQQNVKPRMTAAEPITKSESDNRLTYQICKHKNESHILLSKAKVTDTSLSDCSVSDSSSQVKALQSTVKTVTNNDGSGINCTK